ncbi:MAG TPA: hypothetical protein VF914_08785 [Chloroflexia bacterium]|jgi:hypothetical protein
MHTKCRDLYFFVRRFTRQTFALFVWYLVNAALLVSAYGLNLYLSLLLALTLVGVCVGIANLARLRRLRSEPLAPNMAGRGYLVPAPWLTASEDEAVTSGLRRC